jgi:hypothetical protein
MSNTEDGNQPNQPQLDPVAPGIPPALLPTVFADGFANIAPGLGVVRFYLYRTDPDAAGRPHYRNQVIAQVVMPLTGFVHASVFFEKMVKQLLAQGAITPEMIDQLRKIEGMPDVERGA